jgi:hypothetical protein
MKKTLQFTTILVLAFLWQHCADDQAPAKPGSIRFSLRPTGTANHGRLAAALPDGASLYISIRQAGGDAVYTLEPVALLKFGDEYVSEPLALAGGDYELTEFLVADSAGNVGFATPQEGSELAPWVDDPLPQAFSVTNNAIARVDVQVLSTEAHQPQQFGYVTFQVDVVMPPVFQLAVFKPEGEGLAFSRAHVYLTANGDTVFHQYVPAQTNTINFIPQPNAQYRLTLYEHGFRRYDRYLEPGDFAGGPLKVVLEPAFTFVLNNRPAPSKDIGFTLFIVDGNEDKTFWVDWGDGITARAYTTEEIRSYLRHMYNDDVPHFVSLSGNLELVTRVLFENVPGGVDSVSVQHLPELELFYVATGKGTPATIDFSHNPKLSTIYLEFSSLRSLDVTHNPLLRYIPLNGSTQFTTATIDAFINSLYNAITSQPPGPDVIGYLNIADGFRDSMVPIGPPSEEAREKLRILANTYGWGIHPQTLVQQP